MIIPGPLSATKAVPTAVKDRTRSKQFERHICNKIPVQCHHNDVIHFQCSCLSAYHLYRIIKAIIKAIIYIESSRLIRNIQVENTPLKPTSSLHTDLSITSRKWDMRRAFREIFVITLRMKYIS